MGLWRADRGQAGASCFLGSCTVASHHPEWLDPGCLGHGCLGSGSAQTPGAEAVSARLWGGVVFSPRGESWTSLFKAIGVQQGRAGSLRALESSFGRRGRGGQSVRRRGAEVCDPRPPGAFEPHVSFLLSSSPGAGHRLSFPGSCARIMRQVGTARPTGAGEGGESGSPTPTPRGSQDTRPRLAVKATWRAADSRTGRTEVGSRGPALSPASTVTLNKIHPPGVVESVSSDRWVGNPATRPSVRPSSALCPPAARLPWAGLRWPWRIWGQETGKTPTLGRHPKGRVGA